MSDLLEQRVEALERQLAELAFEVSGQALRSPGVRPSAAQEVTHWPPVPTSPADREYPVKPLLPERLVSEPLVSGVEAAGMRRTFDLEELVGGRVLALVGGLAVVVGLAFFVALAVSNGWIGQTARVSMAAGASAALLAGGLWLYERQGRSQAALALVGTAIAGMFLTLTAATAGYQLIPTPAALPIALGIGALSTTLAVRWDTRTIAGLGIGGTLVAPVLGNALTTSGMAFLAVASASAAAVLVWRRWPWLAVGASALALGQVSWWALSDPAGDDLVVILSVFAVLNLALALGYEVRDRSAAVQPPAVLLVPFGALILGAAGYFAFPHGVGERAGGEWLLALAVAHAAVAGTAIALRRASLEVTLVLLAAATLLGDIAVGLLGNGWVLGLGWAAAATAFALVGRWDPTRHDIVQLALGSQLALALGHILLFDDRPELLASRVVPGPGAMAALVGVMVAAFASARLLVDEPPEVRAGLDALTIIALAYASALAFDGQVLLGAFAASGVMLARAAGRTADIVARSGALGFLLLIACHVLFFEAPPKALVYGLDQPVPAAVGLALLAGLAVLFPRVDPDIEIPRACLEWAAAVGLLYLSSTAIVSAFQPGPGEHLSVFTGGVRQQGQALLSVFWGSCGIAALVTGLRADLRMVRLGGLGLLALAAAKVFAFDLSTLGSGYRVVSFIGLGLLLLGAAFAYQRLRTSSTRSTLATKVLPADLG